MGALLASIFLLSFIQPIQAAEMAPVPLEHHQYIKQIGDKALDFDWQLNQTDRFELVTKLESERDVTRMNFGYETVSWSVRDEVQKSNLTVTRVADRLQFSGLFKGEEIRRSVAIDEASWFQALSLSLRQFNRSGKARQEFWSIRPDTLDVHRLQVIREEDEVLHVGGHSCDTVRMKIQLTGFKSVFWSCRYWLRKSDGLFIRYEGPSGPPGWPMTTVQLVGPCQDLSDVALLEPVHQ